MKSKLLGKLEQKIMNFLWASDKALTPREVKDGVCCDLAYTTVMTELSRMTEKGLLKRKKVGKAFEYLPLITKESFAKKNLSELFDGLVGNYGEFAISQFVDTIKDDPENIKMLEDYLKKN